MNGVIFLMMKGTKMDLTCLMKDADVIIQKFNAWNIRFEKKFTTIPENGPGTITFKSLHTTRFSSDLGSLIADIYESASNDEIANVYIRIVPHYKPKKKAEVTKSTDESATEELDDTL